MALMFHLRRMIPHKECHPCHGHPPLPISEPPKPRNSERAHVSIHEHAHGSMMHLETTARYLVITATSGSCGGLVVNWKTTPETECSSFEALVLVDIQQGRCKCYRYQEPVRILQEKLRNSAPYAEEQDSDCFIKDSSVYTIRPRST